jgi:glycosyltransferase involved in cell wall biosynthesis
VPAAVMPISVIIPVRNEGDRIIRAIQSIVSGRSCWFPLELVIVDDDSSDGACNHLPQAVERAPNTRLVIRRLNSWSGIPFARNRGAELASYPIYLITDGNTLFSRNWDLPIWTHFGRGRILATTILDIASSFRGYGCQLMLPSMGVTWIPVAGAYGGYVPVAACTGTVIDRGLFQRLGGYDETLPLYGAAEPEFSVRAWLSGYEIVNVPQLQIYHRFRPRSEYDAFHASNSAVLLKNYIRFACYYLPQNLLARTYEYYHQLSPTEFTNALANLETSDVWIKRAALARQLPRNFQWFALKFSLL